MCNYFYHFLNLVLNIFLSHYEQFEMKYLLKNDQLHLFKHCL